MRTAIKVRYPVRENGETTLGATRLTTRPESERRSSRGRRFGANRRRLTPCRERASSGIWPGRIPDMKGPLNEHE